MAKKQKSRKVSQARRQVPETRPLRPEAVTAPAPASPPAASARAVRMGIDVYRGGLDPQAPFMFESALSLAGEATARPSGRPL